MDHPAGTPQSGWWSNLMLTIGTRGQRGNRPIESNQAGAARPVRAGDQLRRAVDPHPEVGQAGWANAAFAAPAQACGASCWRGFWMAATSSAATVRSLMLRRCEIDRRVANAVAGSQRRWAITIPIA